VSNGRKTGIGDGLCRMLTADEVERGDQQPRGGQRSNADDRLQACRRDCPRTVLAEQCRQLVLHLPNLVRQLTNERFHTRAHTGDHDELLDEGMQLVAHLQA
jgi:hypothetical protein